MTRLALASAPNHSLAPPTLQRMKIPAAAIARRHSSVKVISSEMRRHAAVFAQALYLAKAIL
jgi:hypothetical protein